MTVDPDDLLSISLSHLLEELCSRADELSEPSWAFLRVWEVLLVLLCEPTLRDATLDRLLHSAVLCVVRELRATS